MKYEKIAEILRVLAIFEALSRQQGSWRLGQITDFSTMSRATCDRQLRVMVEMKVISQEWVEYKGRPCRVFSIAPDGRELMQVLGV